MPGTPNKVILPQTIGNGACSLVGETPITSRTNITGTAGLVKLKDVTANGAKVYEIKATVQGNASAGTLCIWRHDGTTSRLFDELQIGDQGSLLYSPNFNVRKEYDNLCLKPTESLYCSVTVANDLNVFADVSDF